VKKNIGKRPFKKPFRQKDKYKTNKPQQKKSNDENVRLNRYLSMAGICSRREADQLIAAGVVKVNGKTITEMGFKVSPTDEVNYGGETLRPEKKVYLLLNKPKDFITTRSDPQDRRTVMNLVGKACKELIYPVGRLDRMTTGLLMFTNDGDLARKLTHPSSEIKKIYHVTLDKPVIYEHLKQIEKGIDLEDGLSKADKAVFVGKGEDKKQVGLEIHSGKNRIVRRMFEFFGYRVIKLDRVIFAGLSKKDLPRGKYRFLTEKEVGFLKMI
jgi:23S rRNA pseudouridine2605 synthase